MWKLNKVFLVGLVSLVLVTAQLRFVKAEEGQSEKEGAHAYSNCIKLFLGNAHENEHNEDAFTVGLNYEYRLKESLNVVGIGAFVEYATKDIDTWSGGIPLFIHPYKGLRFALAPGLAYHKGKGQFLVRTGVGYEFLIKRLNITPEFNVDFVDNETALVFGVSFGLGF
jgi:hypothetical protein